MKDSWPRAARSLAEGGTVTDAAKAAGVDPRTVRRWRSDEPQFSDAVEDSRAEMLSAAAASVASLRLADIAKNSPPRYALPASKTILEVASRYRSDLQIEQRLRQLEVVSGLRRAGYE